MLSERSLSQRGRRCLIPLLGGPYGSHIHRDRKLSGGCQGWAEDGMGVGVAWVWGPQEDAEVLEKDGAGGFTTT